MRFGLQKLTLLDYPGVMACTVFTGGCNFRCPFCHNAALVTGTENALPFDEKEVLDFLESRKNMLEGVCITGGEPLLHKQLSDVISSIKAKGYKVKLDTNGSRPEALQRLLNSGLLDYVAMDIKHSKEKYAQASGTGLYLEAVSQSVEILKNSTVPFEFRTTVVSPLHTPDDLENIARWISGAPRYYLQNFIDSGELLQPDPRYAAVPGEILQEMLARVKPFVPGAVVRGK